MPTARNGSFRLFRLAGIDVFLHWSWFLVAAYEFSDRAGGYTSPVWNAVEYLALFAIVTLHEFGHALACRSVGGRADRIVLWPLGGVAYVDPPPRPGAVLWSIAAGPLVNLALVPIFVGVFLLGRFSGLPHAAPDVHVLLRTMMLTNFGLFVFNMLPVYPLDGGQILRALLWFPFGRANSLMAASLFGFAGMAGLIVLAFWAESIWLGLIAAYVASRCVGGFTQARVLMRLAAAPRREGFACPTCRAAPPKGAYWGCDRCRRAFDTFETRAVCPHCGAQFAAARCAECGASGPVGAWALPPPVAGEA